MTDKERAIVMAHTGVCMLTGERLDAFYYDCSACGESWTTIEGTPWNNDMNYCPHCGAKMEADKDGAAE